MSARSQQSEDLRFFMSSRKELGLSRKELKDWVQERMDAIKVEREAEREAARLEKEPEREVARLEREALEKREEAEKVENEKKRAHELQMLQIIVPAPALVPVPEHAPDLHSRDPNKDPLSSPGLALLPVPVRETDPAEHSGSSPKGAASHPVPEPVIPTWEPLTHALPPGPLPLSQSQFSTDIAVSNDSAVFQMANELKELRRIVIELAKKAPASAVEEADTGGTPIPSPGSVPQIPRPRQTIQVGRVRGENTTGVDNSR
ncbi:uncharacterized protein [Macrobrachium rosenbergii]|uniref:uncharacterized protein n=1 Tax=Macrobrachium rosenbergii TaxID=79674 RepID=UPI0034D61988